MPARKEQQPREQLNLEWGVLLDQALSVEGDTGNTYTQLHQYSYLNTLLLRMQGVTPPVASYARWKEVGRHVVKGAAGAIIIRPITVHKRDEDGEIEDSYRRFKQVRGAFGYDQTDGEELSSAEIPDWSFPRALGELAIREVPFTSMTMNTQGRSHDREMAINPIARFPDKTRLHEIGHIVLGHTTEAGIAEYQQHQGMMEFEAEGTAHLAGTELGILDEEQASVSRGYLQGWLRGEKPSDTAIRSVFKATDLILRAGRVQAPEAV